ncbi:hypothetical protein J6590_040760 [Homalodisca vitripennis]|nr:hypothetical protein J6590_040760 [Homalodisca vitripennis]
MKGYQKVAEEGGRGRPRRDLGAQDRAYLCVGHATSQQNPGPADRIHGSKHREPDISTGLAGMPRCLATEVSQPKDKRLSEQQKVLRRSSEGHMVGNSTPLLT